MRLIIKLSTAFLINAIAFLMAARFIEGFILESGRQHLFLLAGILTIIHLFIRPILRFLFTPLIVITLGLFAFIINGTILWLLDFFSPSITIIGLTPLVYGTLLFTVVNIVIRAVFNVALKKH
jgi:putative membrane protein